MYQVSSLFSNFDIHPEDALTDNSNEIKVLEILTKVVSVLEWDPQHAATIKDLAFQPIEDIDRLLRDFIKDGRYALRGVPTLAAKLKDLTIDILRNECLTLKEREDFEAKLSGAKEWVPLDLFSKFPELPLELREEIWVSLFSE